MHVASFRRGLSEIGYVEGRNVAIEYRWASGRYQDLPEHARELVNRGVSVMAAVGGAPSALAAHAATQTIPSVFVIGDDPVALGIVSTFNRPGGNATGVSFLTGELGPKRLDLISSVVPNASPIAFLLNPNDPKAKSRVQDVQATADAHGRRLVVLQASAEAQFEQDFATLARERVGALVVQNDPFFDSQRDRLVALATRHRIPAIYHICEFPDAGGLMSYGASLSDAYRQAGSYVGRILKGEKPGELPIVRLTKFELVINLRTAKSLTLTVPQSVLLLADDVIK